MPIQRPLQRVLVTGGAGFIGSALLRRLLARPGIEGVRNYDALTYAGLPESVAELEADPRYGLVHADVTDPAALTETIDAFRPDVLMHLAAESHVDRSIADPQRFVTTNVVGTATVLAAWRAYRDRVAPAEADGLLLLHVSTDEVYGSLPAGEAAVEGDLYRPSSPYSAAKAGADHLVQAYRRTYGLSSILAYPTNNYGPRQFPEKLVPLATLRALRNEPIPLYGDGLQVRDWLHVDDCAEGLIAIAERGEAAGAYHLGAATAGEREWSNRQVVEAIADGVDELRPSVDGPRRRLIECVDDRPGHDRRYALDSTKARTELGWRPTRELSLGIRETVRWYLENPVWVAAAERRGGQ
ncbi:dTDP-glucose 4,6-dehydratase [Planctomycetes bacterium MalM25]|nr:dTDP-glucose 4,6-dehydratase [Planctomycetes bacterium MalM25]